MRACSAILAAALLCCGAEAAAQRKATRFRVEATAYTNEGVTKSGLQAQRGLIASDPKFLPIGTEVEIRGIGIYSGRYLVADTGQQIKGREVDIYIDNDAAAKKFGRKRVWLRVLKWGDGQADRAAR